MKIFVITLLIFSFVNSASAKDNLKFYIKAFENNLRLNAERKKSKIY